ncbi:40-residue YVTN family beta-propeller repeat-containing protein [Cellulosimicrobium aquatile]|uniref:40-residue YVTN family beta-propeller repeat-containing protein n=1 Tax=Cellulosimicrobium aquatile TaxID=1612203 RepID=A0A1N6TSX9_9MICO|nr:YncE family protein [Cellulosimicrobium aquatile]SIQ56337.1 40-residue YVTN family beta-propeller repeat-containing protein [Cellulosimicrobium aquatile]
MAAPPVPRRTDRPGNRRPRHVVAWAAALGVAVLAACTPGGAGDDAAPAAPPSPAASPQTPATTPADGPTTPAPDAVPAVETPRFLLATEAESDGLAVVDPTIREGSAVVDRIEVGAAPWGVAVHAPTMRAYVSTAQGVAVVNLATRERVDLLPYRDAPARVAFGEYRRGGMGIAVSPDGARVHVAVHRGDSSTLETIDVASREVVASTPVGLRPFDVLVAADGGEVYTVDHDTFSVHVVDTTTFEARRIEVAPFGTDGGLASFEKPHYAVLDDDGSLLLPYQGRVLVRLDPATGTTTTVASAADSHQHGVARAPDGRVVVVGNGPFGNATGGPNVTVLDPATGAEQVTSLTRRHETVTTWTDPATGRPSAVLAGGYTQAEAWDGATVVDLGTLDTYEIQIPGRPQVVVPLPEGPAA